MSDEKPQEQEEPKPKKQHDFGKVTKTPRFRISVAWILPLIAALAAGYMFWSQWDAEGEQIVIQFENAPGLQPGKTPLVYRGVQSGMVEDVRLDDTLQKAIVTVRLKKFANELASEGTLFWIERPTIGISQVSGLESIIEGNSIRAQIGQGPPAKRFTGLSSPPIVEEYEPGLSITLTAPDLMMLTRGASVFHRGAKVGSVEEMTFLEDGEPSLRLTIEHAYIDRVRSTSRFWAIAPVSMVLGPGGIQLQARGLDILAQGGIAFDDFGREGGSVENGTKFHLAQTEAQARASGPRIEIDFDDAGGLRKGATRVSYLGRPIGVVESLVTDRAEHRVRTFVRMQPGFEDLLTDTTSFVLVRPSITLEGVTGLETLLTGAYIDLRPGDREGTPTERFTGTAMDMNRWTLAAEDPNSLRLRLRPREETNLNRGAPIYFRGIEVGTVTEKTLDADGKPVLDVLILEEFRDRVASNARFWIVPAASLTAGSGNIRVDVPGVSALIQGGIAFEVLGAPEGGAKPGDEFNLFPDQMTARADSVPIRITFDSARGLVEGQTVLRYLGLDVGLVEKVIPINGQVQVVARLNHGYDHLRREGSRFTLVEPNLTMLQTYGVGALLSGVHIEVTPSPSGPLLTSFDGGTTAPVEDLTETGLEIRLVARQTRLEAEAPIYFRGILVGRVRKKQLSEDGRGVVLTAEIDRAYSGLIFENTKFWDAGALEGKFGWFSLRLQLDSIISAAGRVAFATPDQAGRGMPARPGQGFILYQKPEDEWLKWDPQLPRGNRPDSP